MAFIKTLRRHLMKKKLRDKLHEVYRLVIIDEENLREVANYRFSMRRLYFWAAVLFFCIAAFVTGVIAFSPFKRLMPGYGKIESNKKFVRLQSEFQQLKEDFDAQNIYIEGLKKMIAGDNVQYQYQDTKILQDTTHHFVSGKRIKDSHVAKRLTAIYFVSPVLGEVSAPFDLSIDHFGIDILTPKDMAVKSVADGVVISSDYAISTGNTIIIQHQDDIITVYKHNSGLLKKTGDRVKAGEAIAIVGNSGKLTTGPHLHFELWYGGRPVNPADFISFK